MPEQKPVFGKKFTKFYVLLRKHKRFYVILRKLKKFYVILRKITELPVLKLYNKKGFILKKKYIKIAWHRKDQYLT